MLYIIVILNCLISYIVMTYAHDENSNLFKDKYYYIVKTIIVINIILATFVYVTR